MTETLKVEDSVIVGAEQCQNFRNERNFVIVETER